MAIKIGRGLRGIKDATITDANVIFPTVHASPQPVNLALHKPARLSVNDTGNSPKLAVDGEDESYTLIRTYDVRPFLAVDLGSRVKANSVLFRMRWGE